MKDVRNDLLKLADECKVAEGVRPASVWKSDEARNAALVAAQKFYEDSYGEIAHSSIYLALAEYRERGFRAGGNYTANDDVWPSEIYFANGRKIGIAFNGDKPYLTIGHITPHGRCDTCGTELVRIRGQYPGSDNRDVCPQCVQEKLEDLQTAQGRPAQNCE